MFCTKCGKELQDGAKFCIGCGAKVGKAPAEARPAKEKKTFDPMKVVASATENVAALKTNKKLLIMVGGGLAAILIIIMIIVIIAVNTKKPAASPVTGKTPPKDVEFYFERPLLIGQIVEFGEYEQDGNTANGKEPIKWQVLEVSNDRYLLLAHNVLDIQPFDDGSSSSGAGGLSHGSEFLYEDSSLRGWLNNSFDAEAFGEKERKYIIPVSFRNDVITVSKDNQYARDLSFILSARETALSEAYLGSMKWYYCAPPTQYALSKGAETVSVLEYVGSIPEKYENKVARAMLTFHNSQTDYFDIGYTAAWYVRDIDKESKTLSAHYTGFDDEFYHSVPVSTKLGVRPAIYISADACYKAPVEVDEKLGSAFDKMSEYKGTYTAKKPDAGNYIDLIIGPGYFDIDSQWDFVRSENEALQFLFDYMKDRQLLMGRYNMSDYEYSILDGNDCFTDYNKGMRLIYDSKEDKWSWYLNFPKGTNGLMDANADQWQFYVDFLPKSAQG